jgi:hypothetical protein
MQGDNDTLIRCILIHCWWPLIRELSLTDSFLSGTCRELVSLDLEVLNEDHCNRKTGTSYP